MNGNVIQDSCRFDDQVTTNLQSHIDGNICESQVMHPTEWCPCHQYQNPSRFACNPTIHVGCQSQSSNTFNRPRKVTGPIAWRARVAVNHPIPYYTIHPYNLPLIRPPDNKRESSFLVDVTSTKTFTTADTICILHIGSLGHGFVRHYQTWSGPLELTRVYIVVIIIPLLNGTTAIPSNILLKKKKIGRSSQLERYIWSAIWHLPTHEAI